MTASPQQPTHYTEPSFVDVRGLQTAYRRAGSGPTVVFLHAGGVTRPPAGLTRKWLPFYERLSSHVDLIVPEHPGFGDTPVPSWMRSIDDVVTHLDELLDLLGAGDVHLVGHSLGGWIAARFAVVHPQRLQTLTLVSPLGIRVPGVPVSDYFRMTNDEADQTLFHGHGDRYAEQLQLGDQVEGTVLSYREITSTARIAWNPRYDIRFERLLGRVTCPALVVAAQEDNILPRAHCEAFAAALPGARVEVVEGGEVATGHLALVQEPERLASMISSFITTEGASHA